MYLPHQLDDLFAGPLAGFFDTKSFGSKMLIYKDSGCFAKLTVTLFVVWTTEFRHKPLESLLAITLEESSLEGHQDIPEVPNKEQATSLPALWSTPAVFPQQ